MKRPYSAFRAIWFLLITSCGWIHAGDPAQGKNVSEETRRSLWTLSRAMEKHYSLRITARNVSKLARTILRSVEKDGDGRLDSSEIEALLKTIGVGNFFTRGFWTDGILEYGDVNGDRSLDRREIRALLGHLCRLQRSGQRSLAQRKPV